MEPKVDAWLRLDDFKLGDIVETIKGAKFWGRIVSLDNDPDSHPGATVLAIHPEFAGTKHVYPIKQLRHRALTASRSGETGWRPVGAWGVFFEGKLDTITVKKSTADGYRAAGLDVRRLAAPIPTQEPKQ